MKHLGTHRAKSSGKLCQQLFHPFVDSRRRKQESFSSLALVGLHVNGLPEFGVIRE